ncbi:MAG: enoyl-CoA hydratase-related protein [Candidatus Promineifilaceae bacterium]
MDSLQLEVKGPAAVVRLNRPEQHNAINRELIAGLQQAFEELGGRSETRVIVLTGGGPSFCAGADLGMMRAAAGNSYEANLEESQAIFDLMLAVDRCPKPVVGRINGSAFGGGVGLVCCCDLALTVEEALFAFSESRLGIVPAVISPFVLAKIGVSQARALFLTGERFDAQRAKAIGLVHEVVPAGGLDAAVAATVDQLLKAAPGAQAAAKALIRDVAYRPAEEVAQLAAELIAGRRASPEGQEGMAAFLERRRPDWQSDARQMDV